MEYTKKEFEAIVLAGILWEEIVDKGLESKGDSSILKDHKVDLSKEMCRCPLCTMFNHGNEDDCESCPLGIIGQSCKHEVENLFQEWISYPTTVSAKAVLEGIYNGSDGCTVRK